MVQRVSVNNFENSKQLLDQRSLKSWGTPSWSLFKRSFQIYFKKLSSRLQLHYDYGKCIEIKFLLVSNNLWGNDVESDLSTPTRWNRNQNDWNISW